MTEYLILSSAAFFAGLIDAVVGGGGLINVPALFSIYPVGIPATLLGTNKLAGIWGTAAAAVNYARAVSVRWSMALPASVGALCFSFIGAYTVPPKLPCFLIGNAFQVATDFFVDGIIFFLVRRHAASYFNG